MEVKLHLIQIFLILALIIIVFFAGQGTANIVNNSCPTPVINNFIDVNVITPPITFDSNMFNQNDRNYSPNIIVQVDGESKNTSGGETTYVTNNYFTDNNSDEDITYYDFSLTAIDGNGDVILDETGSFANGTPALDAMQDLTTVEYTQYSWGVMIISIKGVSAGQQEYWALYVDGNYASVGISDITVDSDISLEWKIESW